VSLTQLKHLGEALLDFTLEGILNTNPNRVDVELVKVMQQVAEVLEDWKKGAIASSNYSSRHR
jgi:hypothetical protein